MRRGSVATVLLLLGSLLAATGPMVAEARTPNPTVRVGAAWIVAGGAAAQARLDVTCQPGDEPIVLGAELAKDEIGPVTWASGELFAVACTGRPTRVVVPLSPHRTTIEPGRWAVRYHLTNCVDELECDTVSGRRDRDVEHGRFRTPYDDDIGAELQLRRARLTTAGDVRLVYDMTCGGTPHPLQSRLWQVQRGGLLGSSAQSTAQLDSPLIFCGPEGERFRYTVPAPDGTAFRPRRAFLHTDVGQWHNWLSYATDRQVVRLEPPRR